MIDYEMEQRRANGAVIGVMLLGATCIVSLFTPASLRCVRAAAHHMAETVTFARTYPHGTPQRPVRGTAATFGLNWQFRR